MSGEARKRQHIAPVGQGVIRFEEFETEEALTASPEQAPVAAGEPISPDRIISYASFGSGSAGNCCYIATSQGGVLIDAGLRPDEISEALRNHGIPMANVKALLLTHDHSDHARFAYSLLRAHRHIRLYCTNRVLQGMLRKHGISKRIKDYHTPIFKEIPFNAAGFGITAFEVPHDGTDNMGFSLEFNDRRFVIATDLGAITERARHYMSRANYLVIESNYDLHMLRSGRYPEHLKARIQLDSGHLDNAVTARFLTEIINPELRYIFLCHLSQDNNTPEIALRESREALEASGIRVGKAEETLADRSADVQLMALPRSSSTRLFRFRP